MVVPNFVSKPQDFLPSKYGYQKVHKIYDEMRDFLQKGLHLPIKMKWYQNSRGRSYGVGMEVTWSRCGFNLCVAPLYGNRGVLVFQRVGKRGCLERGAEWMGKLRLGAEGLQRV